MKVRRNEILKVISISMTVFFALFLLISSVVADESSEDLKEQLKVLQKKIETMEKQQAEAQKAPAAEKTEKKATQAGYFLIPGTETEMKIGGFAKFDFIYNDRSAGEEAAADQFFDPPSIPLKDSPTVEKNQVVLHARQSRINVATSSDTPLGKLKTMCEGDFFGAGGNQNLTNSHTFRLRLFYGEMGKFLAGQNTSTFVVLDALSDTVDFGGPVGHTLMRQGMIRYTEPYKWGSLQFALENGHSSTVNSAGTKTMNDDDPIPDFIGRLNLKSDKNSFSFILMARELCWDSGTTDDKTVGVAACIGGKVATVGKDDLRFLLLGGNGIGRYMTTGFADIILDDRNAEEPEVKTFMQMGATVAYRHFWNEKLRSNIVLSYAQADNDLDIVPETVNSKFNSLHLNLIWNPIPKFYFGGEYLRGYRELESGDEGELNRVQFSAWYSFL